MRFLLRMAFWLTVILGLLPSGGTQPGPKVNVTAGEAMSAANATVTDMGSFCHRQAEACAVGSQAAAGIGQRVQAGAKMLFEFLNEQRAPGMAKQAAKSAPTTERSPQQTLAPGDLLPVWRSPQGNQHMRREQAAAGKIP